MTLPDVVDAMEQLPNNLWPGFEKIKAVQAGKSAFVFSNSRGGDEHQRCEDAKRTYTLLDASTGPASLGYLRLR